MKKLTVIDFFCGAGGFSEGFRQQGFEIVAGYDIWKPAIETYNYNFGVNSKIKDILDFKDSIGEINLLPDTDVIIGSPPCVSFSSSNISGKADKESGVLLTKIFLRIVAVKKFQKDTKLKAWFMENVANSRNYLADYYTFKDLGLGEWAKKNRLSPNKKAIILKDRNPIINSADYGSYQSRRRAITGEIIKLDKLIIPLKTHSEIINGKLPQWKTLGELLKKMPSPNSSYSNQIITDPIYYGIKIPLYKLTDHFYDSGLYKSEWKQSQYYKTNHPYMGKMAFPENLSKPSRTITATKSGTSREALIYKSEYNRHDDGMFRSPTIREAASIMGFPYTYQFLGSINNKWRLVGNAVCPTVSRTLAIQLKELLGIEVLKELNLEKEPNFDNINNLNTFSEKVFNQQPIRVKNSRFRRHPFKDGNLTVTLSNYDIESNSDKRNKWMTSIQYGTGEGFPIQNISDGFYKKLESVISSLKEGNKFLEIINNGFSEKIGSATELQKMYVQQKSVTDFIEPSELVEEVRDIIQRFDLEKYEFVQKGTVFFKHKSTVPVKQILALYAINKISSIANKG